MLIPMILVILALLLIMYYRHTSNIDEINENDIPDKLTLDIDYQKSGGTNWCLVACISMLLDYYGINHHQNVIAKEIMMENGSGSNIQKAIRYVNNLGFDMIFSVIYINDIPKYIYQDIPVVAIMGYKLSNPACHARIAKGYDLKRDILIFSDPSIVDGYELTFNEIKGLSLVGSNTNYVHVIIMTKRGE